MLGAIQADEQNNISLDDFWAVIGSIKIATQDQESTGQGTAPTSTPIPTAQPQKTDAPDGVVRPEVKKMLDSYEEYMDEYISFMERYANTDPSNAISMLNEYSSMMQQYIDFAEKIEKLGDEDLSNAELSYYLEVVNRVNQKLLKATS